VLDTVEIGAGGLQANSEIDSETRELLWRSKEAGGGFEDTLADLQNSGDERSKTQLDNLSGELVGMFNAMGQGFKTRGFEFRNPPEVRYMVATFLAQFDAIFTLNQDTLLDDHYLGRVSGGRYNGCDTPGLGFLHANTGVDPIAPRQPDPKNFLLSPGIQPYIKLHGSCNWNAGTPGSRILIMGGQKAITLISFRC
jgi:hypothetical protein